MDAFEKLKKACINKPFVSVSNLPEGNYIVQRFQRLETFNGPRVRVELKDYIVYLPDRFVELLCHDTIKELNQQKVIMKHMGKDPEDSNRLKLDFEVIQEVVAASPTTTENN